MFVYCQPFSNYSRVVLFQTLPVRRAQILGVPNPLSVAHDYIYTKMYSPANYNVPSKFALHTQPDSPFLSWNLGLVTCEACEQPRAGQKSIVTVSELAI